MSARMFLIAQLVSSGVALAAAQQTYYVDGTSGDDAWNGLCQTWDGGTCGPKATIQAGIDAAGPGDIVEVAAGVYSGAGNRDLMLGDKALTVRSAGGAATCTIDCGANAGSFIIDPADPPAPVSVTIEGFTITNGYRDYGGGVFCNYDADVTIANCAIRNCEANNSGGAVYGEYNSVVMITDCVFTSNQADYGGAVELNGDENTVSQCTFRGNVAGSGGGGLYIHDSAAVTDCTFFDNQAGHAGGGAVRLTYGSMTLQGSTFEGNVADSGGAIYLESETTTTLSDCHFLHNRVEGGWSYGDGGGIYCGDLATVTLTNSLLADNSAYNQGGALYLEGADATVTHCTIVGNEAATGGAVCHVGDPSTSTLANCILWNNAASTGPELYVGERATMVVSYSDVAGGFDAAFVDPGCPACSLDWGVGNIDADPLFASASDYYLSTGSPCIDAGDPNMVVDPNATDLAGAPRFEDGDENGSIIVDMGAYEHNPTQPLIVATPIEMSFVAVEGGIDPAPQVLSIRNVGAGTLNWTVTPDVGWLDASPSSGSSTGETDDVTVSVDIAGLTGGTHTATLTISDAQAVNSPVIVDVTLTIGQILLVPGEYATIQAAIDAANDGDIVELADGTYTGAGNRDLDFGGKAITVRSASGDPSTCIIDCEGDSENFHRGFRFHTNEGPDSLVAGLTITGGYWASGYYGGGAILCDLASPTIENCILVENSADPGGAICVYDSDVLVARCQIVSNLAIRNGGGIYVSGGSPILRNCVVADNEAGSMGGGVVVSGSAVTIDHCTIRNNRDNDATGGIAIRYGSSPTLRNSIVWGNEGEIAVLHSQADLTVSHCNIEGGWPGVGNIDADPLFVADNDAHIGAACPCVDAGDPNSACSPDDIDLDGSPRCVDGDGDGTLTPDMGAYEYQPGNPLLSVTPLQLNFSALVDGPAASPQTITIQNVGGATLSWNVSTDESWLSADPPSGSSGGEADTVDVEVDITALAPGTYTGQLTVSAPAAINSPLTVSVTLTVNRILHVPADYATIQEAVDAAIDGDTVLVADGVYAGVYPTNGTFEAHVVCAKAITIRSENGPESCIIEGSGTPDGLAVSLEGYTGHTTFEGFTVSGWTTVADLFTGAAIIGSNVTVRNCVFRNNDGDNGAAVMLYPAYMYEEYIAPVFEDTRIEDNTADVGPAICPFHESGIWYAASVVLRRCTFRQNSAAWDGGAIYGTNLELTAEDCSFIENGTGFGNGGAVFCDPQVYPQMQFVRCDFYGNTAMLGTGGAIHFEPHPEPAAIVNCRFGDNWADAGGAMAAAQASLDVRDSLIVGNLSLNVGGAAYLFGGTNTLTGCVVYGNGDLAELAGGLYNAGTTTISNSILYNNGGIDEAAQLFTLPCCGHSEVNYSCLEGWTGTLAAEGTFDADPLFVDPAGADGMLGTADDDFRLAVGSPCIDAGDNTAVPADSFDLDGDGDTTEPTPVDLAGAPRFVDVPAVPDTGVGSPPIVDIGAYELAGLGDCTGNGVWEMDDVNVVLGCVEGPDSPTLPACACGDLDGDGDVDIADIAILQELFEAE